MSRRKLLGYALCVALFAGTVALAIRLSFPPDPWAARLRPSSARYPDVSVDGAAITVLSDGERRRYELFGTERGLVAAERGSDPDQQEP